MTENTPWVILLKHFQDQSSTDEKEQIRIWIEEDEENRKIYDEAHSAYLITSAMPKSVTTNKEKAWQIISRRISGSGKQRITYLQIFNYSAAAVGLLLIGISLFWLTAKTDRNTNAKGYFTEVIAPPGQKARVVLPDSTMVWLNAGSSVRYNSLFNMKNREVTMTGEAFFQVKRDEKKKFRVRSGSLDVVVYGTSFNIKNYSDDIFHEITVMEGKIGLISHGRETRQLTQGDQAVMNRKINTITYKSANPEVVAAWIKNELVFDNTPIEEVIKYLERWYGVNISIHGDMKRKHNYTFRVKTETAQEMLELMKMITPLRYEINGKDIKISYIN